MTRAVELAQVASNGVSEAFKNRIINGAMVIDQRNAGASVTAPTSATGGGYTIDRWFMEENTDGAATVQQVTDAPSGLSNSMRITVTSTDTSLASNQFFEVLQSVEGFNWADTAWGTADAKTVTLSFWVKSSLTGLFSGSLRNSAYNYSYPFSYTINSANTWEQKSVTISGPTAGTWVGATNGAGVRLTFCVAGGSSFLGTADAWVSANRNGVTGTTNLMATNAATWQITGVQLEVGSTATSFDYRPYGTELQLCQRYYQTFGGGDVAQGILTGTMIGSSSFLGSIIYTVPFRASPTLTATGTLQVRTADQLTASSFSMTTSATSSSVFCNTTTGTAGQGGILRSSGVNNGVLNFSAEL